MIVANPVAFSGKTIPKENLRALQGKRRKVVWFDKMTTQASLSFWTEVESGFLSAAPANAKAGLECICYSPAIANPCHYLLELPELKEYFRQSKSATTDLDGLSKMQVPI